MSPIDRWGNSHYNALKKVINDYDLHILIVLDEVDKLLNKSGDNLLYNLLDTGRISLIMITNNVTCFDKIEDRVKSRLGDLCRGYFSLLTMRLK